MNRRGFFTALLSAPAAVPSLAKEAPLRMLEIQGSTTGVCACGSAMFPHGSVYEGTLYFTCVNETCEQFNTPVVLPHLAVERADPEVVRAVQREEKSQEAASRRFYAEPRRHFAEESGVHHPWKFRP